MEPSPGTVDLASLAPPLRALFEGQQATVEALRAELAALTDRNRRLEEQGPEVLVEELHAKVVSLTDRNRNLEHRNRRLEHLVRELRRAIYAKKSEKLHPDQLLLAFEELEGALAEAETNAPASTTPTPRAKRPAAVRNIGHLPAHLPRVFDVIEPQSTLCPCGCGEMTKIGEDRTERLHIVPAKLQVIVTVRPKYACRKCEEGVTQAPAPTHLIEGALPTEGMLAHVLVSKFADHLPLYRQSQIYARSGLDLHRSTLAGWVGKASFHLRPVFECLKAELKTSNHLGLDETTVRVLDPGRGKTKTGYMWTMARDERGWSGPDPPGVVYDYAPSRSGKHGEKLLDGFQGTVQVDGYSGHNRPAPRGPPGRAADARGMLGPCQAWPQGDVRQQRLADRQGRAEAHRAAVQDRGQDPGRATGDAPVRAVDRVGPAGERLRGLARRAALARLAALALGREAHLYRQPVGRATGVPVRRARGDGLELRRESNPSDQAHREERPVRRP